MSTSRNPTRNEPACRVAVLGGTGLIGSAIVRALAQGPCQVTAIGRRATPSPPSLQGANADYVAGDLEQPGVLERLTSAHDVVIDAAAPYALHLLTSRSRAERYPVEHAGARTARLIEVAVRHRIHLVHLGTQLADASRQPVSPAGLQGRLARALFPYFQMKRVMQRQLTEAAGRGLRVTIVRPTVCIGPWDAKPRAECWVPKLVSGQIPASLSHRINVIDTRDVAAGVRAIVDAGAPQGIVDLCGHNTTTDQLMRVLCDEAGVNAPGVRIPAPLGLLPLLGIEMLWATVGSPSPLPAAVVAMLCEQGWSEPSPSQQALGMAPRPLASTARDTIGWYRGLGYC
jgi:dihydroflavonol-4-reductase